MLELYTIAIPQWRKAIKLEIPLIDITVKSGDKNFAPHPDHLWKYKRGEIGEEEYTELYLNKLDALFHYDPSIFEKFIDRDYVGAVACYCTAGTFCHRHLFIDYIMSIAEDNGLDVQYRGEIV
jgi:hypothetical protein